MRWIGSNINYSCKVLLVFGVITSLGTGCADFATVDEDFGNASRQMVYAQTYNKRAAVYPSPQPVKGMYGPVGELVFKEYRNSVSKPEQVKETTINFDLGGGGAQ